MATSFWAHYNGHTSKTVLQVLFFWYCERKVYLDVALASNCCTLARETKLCKSCHIGITSPGASYCNMQVQGEARGRVADCRCCQELWTVAGTNAPPDSCRVTSDTNTGFYLLRHLSGRVGFVFCGLFLVETSWYLSFCAYSHNTQNTRRPEEKRLPASSTCFRVRLQEFLGLITTPFVERSRCLGHVCPLVRLNDREIYPTYANRTSVCWESLGDCCPKPVWGALCRVACSTVPCTNTDMTGKVTRVYPAYKCNSVLLGAMCTAASSTVLCG